MPSWAYAYFFIIRGAGNDFCFAAITCSSPGLIHKYDAASARLDDRRVFLSKIARLVDKDWDVVDWVEDVAAELAFEDS